jgi:hypothetical protein
VCALCAHSYLNPLQLNLGVGSQPISLIRRPALTKDRPDATQVYAVIRFDPDMASLEQQVTVKEIVTSLAVAEAEVARLNGLNADKGCRYVWQATRLFAPGVSAGNDTSDASRPAS